MDTRISTREIIARALYENWLSAVNGSAQPRWDDLPESSVYRHRYLSDADAVLRVLAEHGDTGQAKLQAQLMALVIIHWGDRPTLADAIWGQFVAPIVTARDDAVERAERAEAERAQWQSQAMELDKAAASERTRAERAEADLAAARQQLDQVRRTYDAWTEEGLGTFPGGIENTHWADAWRDLGADLDVPARSAGHDESGQHVREQLVAAFADDSFARNPLDAVMEVVAPHLADLADARADISDLKGWVTKEQRRAERAEAESKRRGDLLDAVISLIEHREQRYADRGGTTIKAIPVADLRRAIGMGET
jgi:hypothetical protein